MNAAFLVALFGLLVAQSPEFPKLVVPDAPDLTIKTRWTIDHPDSSVRIEIIYLKGARQRRETIIDRPAKASAVTGQRTHVATTITQCDRRRTVFLNLNAKTYGYSTINDPAEHFRNASRRTPVTETVTGGNVTITIDAVDTGERRRIGRHVARHVVTTTKTESGPGASVRPETDERDGWYVDLPSVGCLDDRGHASAFLVGYVQPAGTRDRVQVRHLRTARLGYPVDETDRTSGSGATSTTKIELIEFSERPLDPGLFDVPTDYRPALPGLYGGFDLSKPDTLLNRVESYWQELVKWSSRLFR
jgi:hypothetical protein